MWNLDQAIQLCRELEKTASANGFHVALSGSVLRDGKSDKDVDVIVYPHKTNDGLKLDGLMGTFYSIHRITDWNKRNHEAYGDGKDVFSATQDGKRIDFFFLK